MVELFKEQVAKTPQNVAIEYQNIQLTYETFDKLTNKFANSLLNAGIRPGDKVPLIMKRSEKNVNCHLGSIKGGVCVCSSISGIPRRTQTVYLKTNQCKSDC
ncbi:AMP-binding protein [Lactiplantibacillus plantarum]|uniref:AMP-binding protein n=1 Tax=Lactiplantibacillus plantarum TaxID=1590 RepID=UPI00214CB075|nr:AMP-binding protein [Lactiplantibacillus plantarum]